MTDRTADELLELVETTAQTLASYSQELARKKPAPGKWSIQEILGHLMDSAVNNHHRFVRAQEVEVLTFPDYQQDHWVGVQGYNESPWPELNLWINQTRTSTRRTGPCRIRQ